MGTDKERSDRYYRLGETSQEHFGGTNEKYYKKLQDASAWMFPGGHTVTGRDRQSAPKLRDGLGRSHEDRFNKLKRRVESAIEHKQGSRSGSWRNLEEFMLSIGYPGHQG